MKYKYSVLGLTLVLLIFMQACSKNDAPDNEPDNIESQTLPSWNIDTYVYSTYNGSRGYKISLIGDYDGISDLEKGVIVSQEADPTLESADKTQAIPEQGETGNNFLITINGLSPNTTYYLRTYKVLEDRTDYGEAFMITTKGFYGSCRVTGQSVISGLSNTSSNSRYYGYDDEGKLISYRNTVGSVGRNTTSFSSIIRLYRYDGNTIFKSEWDPGTAFARDVVVGTLQNGRINNWSNADASYAFSYPNDQTVAIKMHGMDGTVDSLVHHLNTEGNIELSQTFTLTENGYSLKSESRYNYSEFINPFKGNIEEVEWVGYFTTHLISKIEKRTLPSTNFETFTEYSPQTRPVNRDDFGLYYTRYDLVNLIGRESCD